MARKKPWAPVNPKKVSRKPMKPNKFHKPTRPQNPVKTVIKW